MTDAPDRRAGEAPVVSVPAIPTLRQRANGWRYAAMTTNPPRGHVDRVVTAIVLTRAAVLPMTLVAGLLAGLLAVRRPEFRWPWYLLALLGVTLAHVANNVMNDLFDTGVGQDTPAYPRAQYAPHPILSGLATRRGLVVVAGGVNAVDLAIMVVLVVARGPWILAFALGGFLLSVAYTAPPLRLKERGLGELDVLVTWGPLMVGGCYFAATGRLPWQVWVAGLPYALLCTAVLMGKHTEAAAAGTADQAARLPGVAALVRRLDVRPHPERRRAARPRGGDRRGLRHHRVLIRPATVVTRPALGQTGSTRLVMMSRT